MTLRRELPKCAKELGDGLIEASDTLSYIRNVARLDYKIDHH